MSTGGARRFQIIGAAAGLIFLLLLAECAELEGYLPIRRFNAAEWRSAREQYSGVRLPMIEPLRWSGSLNRASRGEVLRLLGPGDRPGDYAKDWDLVYYLGPERGFLRVDDEWLVIRFGRDGRVSEYRTVTD